MTIPIWLLIILAIVGLITWISVSISKDNKKRLSCVTCGNIYSNQSNLVKCDDCGLMFCLDNHEFIEDNSSSSYYHIDISTADKNAKKPCGSISIEHNKLKHNYCKLHTPSIGISLSINYKKN